MCKRASLVMLERNGRLINFRPDCMDWPCSQCAPKLRAHLESNAKARLDGFRCIYRTVIRLDEWERVYDRMRRRGNRDRQSNRSPFLYICCRTPFDIHVFTIEPISESSERLPTDAATLLVARFCQSASRKNQVSFCHAWSQDKRETAGYTKVATGVDNESVLVEASQIDPALNPRVREFKIPLAEKAVCVSAQWDEDQIGEFIARVKERARRAKQLAELASRRNNPTSKSGLEYPNENSGAQVTLTGAEFSRLLDYKDECDRLREHISTSAA